MIGSTALLRRESRPSGCSWGGIKTTRVTGLSSRSCNRKMGSNNFRAYQVENISAAVILSLRSKQPRARSNGPETPPLKLPQRFVPHPVLARFERLGRILFHNCSEITAFSVAIDEKNRRDQF